MKKTLRSIFWIAFFGIAVQISTNAQEVDFSTRKSTTIKGDMQMISNTIIGLDGVQPQAHPFFMNDMTNYSPNDAYNGGSYNDGLTIGYIDVDSDGSTFSSSSADFTSNGSCSKIAYAGLYWAASYYTLKNGDNSPQLENLPLQDSRPDFRTLKFKIPGAANYIDILPTSTQVIFDGYRNTTTNPNDVAVKDVPYVCYADVTGILANLENLDGTYTVANMRSTTGETASTNGAFAGWTLVIMYEDASLSTKQLSLQDGFLDIDGTSNKTFTYNNFQTLPPPFPVNARYGIAALEGDFGIVGDGIGINSLQGGFPTTVPLFAEPVNTSTNFFNSSISVDGLYNTARNPASENTLGFDADIFDIPNASNQVIGNNQTSVEFVASTSGDAYRIFLNAFAVEGIDTKLQVINQVQDVNGNYITGSVADLGSQVFYELTVENKGNEGLSNTTITDVLPANVNFLGIQSVDIPNGVTFDYNEQSREIVFNIENALVEQGDIPFTIRFGAEVIATCEDLVDACSNEIKNNAISSYVGIISGVSIQGENSILELDVCGNEVLGSTDLEINLNDCAGLFDAFSCGGNTEIEAGGGFSRYVWTEGADGNGQVLQDSSSPLYSAVGAGIYRVDKTGSPDCIDLVEIWTVTIAEPIENPIIDLADNIKTCPTNAESLPEIYLCGLSDSRVLDTALEGVDSIVWERLDPSACTDIVRDEDCPTVDVTCEPDWAQIATGATYEVATAGEYRIKVTLPGNCLQIFHFNVFKNSFEPQVVVINDIICGTPGEISVVNSSPEFDYQLETPSGAISGYQTSPVFSELTEAGVYIVTSRQFDAPLGSACMFQSNIALTETDFFVNTTAINPICSGELGEINMNVIGGNGGYVYILRNSGGVLQSAGPTNDTAFTFTGLFPGTYEIEVSSDNGICLETQQITILPAPEFTLTTTLTKDLDCSFMPDAEINLSTVGGNMPFIYEVRQTGGSFTTFQGTTYLTNVPGTYEFRVTDTFGCQIISNFITVTPAVAPSVTASTTMVTCSGDANGSVTISIDQNVGTPPYQVSFDGSPFSFETVYNGLESGDYNYVVRDSKQCETTNAVTIIEPSSIVFDTTVTNLTLEENAMITIENTSGGAPGYMYELRDENDVIVAAYQASTIFELDTAGNYIVYAQDTNGCVVSELVTVLSDEMDSPITDYAEEILFCTLTGQSYPVVTIIDENGVALDISLGNVISIVWQQLNEITCDIELDDNCPTTDSSCSSDWFEVTTGSTGVITEAGEYRVIIQFANRSQNGTQIFYFRAEDGQVLNVNDSQNFEVRMFPNPSSDVVTINTEVKNISVFDLTGKMALKTSQKTFNIASLNTGVYFVEIETENGKTTQKLIKQ